jgi:ABC-type glycerol-3-phosphate transport system substrate-binding protein
MANIFRPWIIKSLFSILFIVLAFTSTLAEVFPWQDASTILQIALSDPVVGIYGDAIEQFEATHPGVEVVIVAPEAQPVFPLAGLESYLDSLEAYVSSADVVLVNSIALSVEGTKAGYFLDLKPLIDADVRDIGAGFYDVAWESVQWEGGVWMLPLYMNLLALAVDERQFNELSLFVPQPDWTVRDFETTLRSIHEAMDSPVLPNDALLAAWLMRSISGESFYEDDNLQFDDAALSNPISLWTQLKQDGIVGSVTATTPPLSFTTVPPATDSFFAPLPGGNYGLTVNGLAISAGTQHPELAYELIKALAIHNSQLTAVQAMPARSAQEIEPVLQTTFQNAFPEYADPVAELLSSTLPANSVFLFTQLDFALNLVAQGEPIDTALQRADEIAAQNLAEAQARGAQTIITVAPPLLTEEVAAGGEMRLGVGWFESVSEPDPQMLETVISEFLEPENQIDSISIVPFDFMTPGDYDCVYNSYDGIELLRLMGTLEGTYLDLQPLMASDPEFDVEDFLPNTLTMLDEQIIGYPIEVRPHLLAYDRELFERLGIPLPENGWTMQEFNEALRVIKTDTEKAPFIPTNFDDLHLTMLMIASGAYPIDYRSTPPVIHLSDPDVIVTIQQTLDLIKDGYIDFVPIQTYETEPLSGGIYSYPEAAPIYPVSLDLTTSDVLTTSPQYEFAFYPMGESNTLAYSVGRAYIPTTSRYPEACYRWITTLARHTELFYTMPPRYSLLADPVFKTTQPASITRLYDQLAELSRDPDTVVIGEAGLSLEAGVLDSWLNEAYNQYILDNTDLETELSLVYEQMAAYMTCMNGESSKAWRCALQIDPSLED